MATVEERIILGVFVEDETRTVLIAERRRYADDDMRRYGTIGSNGSWAEWQRQHWHLMQPTPSGRSIQSWELSNVVETVVRRIDRACRASSAPYAPATPEEISAARVSCASCAWHPEAPVSEGLPA